MQSDKMHCLNRKIDKITASFVHIFFTSVTRRMNAPTIKGLAKLLALSMQNGHEYVFCTSANIADLQSGSIRAMKNIFKQANLQINSHDMLAMQTIIEKASPELFTKFLGWNVFGDRSSRDIDLILHVDNLHRPLLSSEVSRLHSELAEMEYDITRGLDINKIYIDSNGFIQFSKGCNETINMVICTYEFHVQKYPLIFTEFVELDIYKKVHSLCTFIANKLELLTTPEIYKILREEKKTIYTSGGLERIDFAIKCMDFFNYVSHDRDTWKSLIMKYLQLILFEQASSECTNTRKSYYQKLGLLKLYKECQTDIDVNINFDIISGLLTRCTFEPDKIEPFEKTIKCLHIKVTQIISENIPRIKWNIQTIDVFNKDTTPLSKSLFSSWILSPVALSDAFCNKWLDDYGENVAINDKFIEPNENITYLNLHPKVMANVIDVQQKSIEWKELIKFYSCGNNTGVVDINSCNPVDILKARSNLVMGCIGETLIAKYFNPSKCIDNFADIFESCTIGMIVEHVDTKGSRGACPDRLFVSNAEIIPAEFKTINGHPSENKGYCRAFSLAKKQLIRCAHILNMCEYGVCTRGIMVFLWIYEENGKWIYEMHSGIILL